MRHPVSHHGGDVCEVGAFDELAYFIGQSRHLAFHSCRVTSLALAPMPHPVGRCRSDELIGGGGRHRAARRSRPICPPLTASAAARAAGPPGIRRVGGQATLSVRYPDTRTPVLGPTSRYRGRPPQGPHETSAFGSERGLIDEIDPLRRCRAARGRTRLSTLRQAAAPAATNRRRGPHAVVDVRYRPARMTRKGLLGRCRRAQVATVRSTGRRLHPPLPWLRTASSATVPQPSRVAA
jgi:hypothetical protein